MHTIDMYDCIHLTQYSMVHSKCNSFRFYPLPLVLLDLITGNMYVSRCQFNEINEI